MKKIIYVYKDYFAKNNKVEFEKLPDNSKYYQALNHKFYFVIWDDLKSFQKDFNDNMIGTDGYIYFLNF